MPVTPLAGELGQADLAVLERWADPHTLLAAGCARVIVKASRGQQGAARANQWLGAARAALELYADHPAAAFQDLAAEVTTELRLLATTQAELDRHASKREFCYRWVDPPGLARSLPGLAEIGGPALVATMGPATRFATAAKFRSFTGLNRQGVRDRPDRPQRPADQQGGQSAAGHHPGPRRRQRPPQLTRSWPAATTCRWSNAAKTISARSAWSPPIWPSAPGSPLIAACPR
jgi:transposase